MNPTAISRNGDSLLIAVCTDAHVTDVRVEARGFQVSWEEVFIATGDAELKEGDVFSTDGSIPGLAAGVAVSPDFNKLNHFMVGLSSSYSKSPLSAASFDVPESGMPEGKWLHWDGKITEEPCPR